MSKNSAAHQKKIDTAARILQTTNGLRVPQAMIQAGFSKSDTSNEIVRQAVRRRHQQMESKTRGGQPAAPTVSVVVFLGDEASLSGERGQPTPSRSTSKSRQLHLPFNNGALTTLSSRGISLMRTRRLFASTMPRGRSRMACLSGKSTRPSRHSTKCVQALQRSAATQSKDSSTHP
jgi:hypothetical protein